MTRSARPLLGVVLAAAVAHLACAQSGPTAASSAAAQEPTATLQVLRVTNVGSHDIEGLIVIFPDERVVLGDVVAGATTNYHKFSKGVFPYAAYDFRAGGSVINQPVIDWGGEQPMPGQSFTYSLEVVGGPRGATNIRLVSTTRDQ